MQPLAQLIHNNSWTSETSLLAQPLRNLFLWIVSPKQLTRPDSMLTCCCEVLPYLKQSFAEQCWKVFFTGKAYLCPEKDDFLSISLSALQAINDLESAIESDNLTQFTMRPENVKPIEFFLSQPLSDSDFIKLNAYLNFFGKNKLWRTLKACRELFLPIKEKCVEILQVKMFNIAKILNKPIDAPLNPDHKLTPKDLRLLTVAETRRKLIMLLNKNGINCYLSDELHTKWKMLEILNNSEVMDDIRERCHYGYKAGRVYFYDWSFIEIKDFYQLDLTWAAKHVLYSRIPHLGIIIKDEENKPKLSHVNGAMGKHGIHPIRFPILGALGNFGELDISSLIPADVKSEDQMLLKKCFSNAFIKFASELHPEVKLEWKPTCLLGHKGLSGQDLSEVDFSAEESQFCSSYVGVVFLKAVNEVNKQLLILGYQEKIPHPFGEHEITNRVDTLRLIYHWKQLKVLKVVPIDKFVNKVFAAPIL